MVEGRFSLGSDWLIVVLRALPLLAFIHHHALYQYVISSHVSRASEWPLSRYHIAFVIYCFISVR